MPVKDWSKYPKNWKTEIRPDILKRANNCCELCGVKNYEIGHRDADGKFYSWKEIEDALDNNGYDYFSHELNNCYDKKGNPTAPIKIVLTIAHMDNNTNNNSYNNLKALCQRCHNRNDVPFRKMNRKKNKGIQFLFND